MAVNRRQKENDTFSDIAHTLPIEENAKELDKASILRIAIHYLRLRDILADCEPEDCDPDDYSLSSTSVPNFSKDVLQALDGFMLLVSKEGKVLFASESISQYLGLRQVDVIGIDLQDIIHPQDFMDVAAIFQSQGHDVGPEMEALGNNHLRRNFVVRMRCAFTPSVRSVTRCSNFKPIYCSAFLKFSSKKVKDGEFLGMVAFCKLASVMKVKELCVGAYFKTKHSLDLSYTAIDTRIRWILGFDPAKMVGLKAYDYFHPQDLMATSSCHTNLLTQGHSHSPCYRFMAQSGDWVWVRSKSCVTYDPVTHHPNGLSIYTWIVRYDEEDDRMKCIMEGKDPGNIGVKDVSKLSPPTSMNIRELCDPNSRPSKPQMISNTLPHTQSHSTSSPQSHISSPHSNLQSSPLTLSSPVMVSPEFSSTAPPNVNPFQTRSDRSPPMNIASPSSTPRQQPNHHQQQQKQQHHYDISSPRTAAGTTAYVGDPFMGVTVPSTTTFGFSDASVQMKPSHYKLEKIRQSSVDSQKESSPPYNSCSATTVYTYSTPSPDNSIGMGLSPGMESNPSSVASYQHHHQTFADIVPPQSSLQQHSPPYHGGGQLSPPYGGHSPYDRCSSYSNSSPYSNDSCCSGTSFVQSPPQNPQGGITTNGGTFAIEATMYMPNQKYANPMESSVTAAHQFQPNQDFGYAVQNIKQEPTAYDAHYYGNPSTTVLHRVGRPLEQANNSFKAQAKARYNSVTMTSGKKFQQSHVKTQEDAAIYGISQWLQQGSSTPVH